VCFAAVLVPPLWEHFIAKPAPRWWDLTKASPEERRLARQQNLAAGWSDWFDAPRLAPREWPQSEAGQKPQHTRAKGEE
jgi:alkane 1-monooxygenase/p-cymene monooxygenase